MKHILFFILSVILVSCNFSNKEGNEQEQWTPLFNGENLDGWDLKITGYPLNDNFGNTFRVEDGLLKVRFDQYDQFDSKFGHIFYNKKFSDYKLRVEYRFVGQQVKGGPGWAYKNSGVMYHSQSAESMSLDQSFPVSLEGQFLGGDAEGERSTMNICTPGTHMYMNGELITRHCNVSSSKTIRGEDWVMAEFVVYNDSIIHHLVDGDTVLTFSRPVIDGSNLPEGVTLQDGAALKEGYIALQSESHPIDFRRVEVVDLSAEN